jgi:hypothetical protein
MSTCDNCGEDLKLVFEYKEQNFGNKLIPAGKFCSNKCLGEHINKNTK